MLESQEELNACIEALGPQSPATQLEIDGILNNLSAFLKICVPNQVRERKGEDLARALECAFNVSIGLFRMVDSGETGLDDQLAQDLDKLKLRYLGKSGSGSRTTEPQASG